MNDPNKSTLASNDIEMQEVTKRSLVRVILDLRVSLTKG